MAASKKQVEKIGEDETKGEPNQQIFKDNGCGLSARHTMVVCLSVGLGIAYFLRFNLSVAMVAMVKNNNNMIPLTSVNITDTGCPRMNTTTTNKTTDGEFDWDPATQGLILSSFFYGYCVLQIPGAWLATRYGPKRLIGSGIFLVSVLSLLTPVAARANIGALIALRAVEGLASGYLFPSVHTMLGRWGPINERAKLLSYMTPGVFGGVVAAFVGTGWLCEQSFLGGWPAAFYIPGVAGCVWCIFWMFLAFDSPSSHPRITKSEYHLIMDSVGENIYDKLPVPWLAMLTCRSFWAVCVGFTCSAWGSYTLMTELPSYMKNVIGVDVKQSGFLSSLPYIASIPAVLVWCYMADTMRQKNIFKVTTIRKIMNTIATVGPASFLILSTFIGCNEYAVIALIAASSATQVAEQGASNANMIDLAPHLAGVIKSVCNTFATLTGIVSPYLAGLLVNDGETKAQWSKVFYITAGVFLFNTVFYGIFASSDLAPWATPQLEVEVGEPEKETNNTDDNLAVSSQTHLWAGNIQGRRGYTEI